MKKLSEIEKIILNSQLANCLIFGFYILASSICLIYSVYYFKTIYSTICYALCLGISIPTLIFRSIIINIEKECNFLLDELEYTTNELNNILDKLKNQK